jgi:O-antigen/teichoic acid export membrane protein
MIDETARLARGTAVLVVSQSCYFVLGYVAVVLMAREFGPAAYGAYGVVMSVLVWLEESGRSAIPSATAKLIAEATTSGAALERTALTLNLAVHALLFIVLWVFAPLLELWFGIENGAFLFRVAALDLPFFGVYTAYRAIYQGRQRFFRLGCTQVIYALTKLIGVLLLISFGLSVENALLVNVAATLIGLACLVPGAGIGWHGRWLEHVAPLVSSAMPMGLYYFVLLLRDWLVLWTLQIMSPAPTGTIIGVFVAAYNIARVPALILTTITTVVLPSVSKAIADKDESLAGQYINRALRFAFIFYLPACLVFMAQPEKLMQWIYSKDFSGGGVVLALLVAGEGLHVIHAIFATALIAAGQARKAAAVAMLSLIPTFAMLVVLVHSWGAAGAALSNALIVLISSVIIGILVWKRFNTLMNKRSVCNIALAACLMFSAFALLSKFEFFLLVSCAGGLAAYFATLIASGEITRQDFAAFVPWMTVQSVT